MSDLIAPGSAGERLAKVIARSGLCSRRDAEGWIKDGRVTVNGKKVVTPAFNVSDKDKVAVDGEPLAAREGTRVWLYHKPAGLVVTEKDPEGRETIFDRLAEQELPRVVTIGRLDINTEGLLLLTNDGGLKRVLELPATGWLRRYRVRAHGAITQPELDRLKDGIEVEGIAYGPIEAILERTQGSNVWLVVSLREGKNREVKNVLLSLGLEVNRLIRVSFGPFQLGDLPEGTVEVVPARVLREQLGRRLAEAAGADFESDMPEVAAQKRAANPKLRASGPGKPPVKASPRKLVNENRFRFEDDTPPPPREEKPRPERPGRGPARPPRKVFTPPAPDVRKVLFDDGREGEVTIKPVRPERGEDRGAPRGPRRDFADGADRPKRSFSDKPRGDGDRPFKSRAPRPDGTSDRPFKSRGPRPEGDADRPFKSRGPRPEGAGAGRPSAGFKPRTPRPDGAGDRPYASRGSRPGGADRPFKSRGPRPEGTGGPFKPRAPRPEGAGDRPYKARPPRPEGAGADRPERSFKPRAPRPDGAPPRAPRKFGDKPAGFGDKPRGSGGKTYGKSAGRPGGPSASRGPRPTGGKPRTPRS